MTSGDGEKVYDGKPLTNSTVTVTGDGFVEGEGATYNVTGTITNPGTAENTFTYTLNEGTKAGNYDIKTVNGTLKVTKITDELTITAKSDSKTYDGTPLTNDGYTYTEGILAEGDVLTAVVEGTITNVGTADNVVTSYKVMRGTEDVTENYTIGTKDGSLEVTKRAVTFTGETATKTYTGSEIELTDVTIGGDGLVSGDTHNVTYSAKGTEVGTYDGTITAKADVVIKNAAGTDVTANYDITTEPGKLTITKTDEDFEISLADDEYTYDATEHYNAKTAESTAKTGTTTFTYSFDEDGEYVADLASLTKVDAGEYTIYVKGTNPNYSGTATTTAKLTIKKREVTVSVEDKSVEYNGSEQSGNTEYTFENVVSGQTATITYTPSKGTLVGEYDNGSYADDFKVMAGSTDVTKNYTLTEKTAGKLTITDRTEPYEIEVVANSNTGNIYDGTEKSAIGFETLTFEVDGNTYVVSGLTTSDPKSVDVIDVANAISGTAVVKDTAGNDVTKQFTVTTTDGQLEITKATVNLASESGEKAYDGTPLTKPEVTVTGNGAEVFQTEVTDIKATGSVTTVAEGEVTNTIVYTEGDAYKADNYTITKSEGTLKITQDESAITIESSTKSWMYDGTVHTDEVYTVTYDGTEVEADSTGKVFTLPTGDTITITATAEGVKDYSADYSENNTYTYVLTNESSYADVTTTTGTLSIEKAPVTLTSESGEKAYDGTPLTKPTVTVTGNGAEVFQTEVTDIKATGSVTTVAEGEVTNTIVFTEGDAYKADNYTITKEEGTLKITASEKPLVISSESNSWTYDGQTHTEETYTVTYDGETIQPDESGKVFTLPTGDTITITPTTEGVKDVADTADGNNSFTFELSNDDSYADVTNEPGTLTIEKRSVTLTSADDEKSYDGTPLTNDEVTIGGEGFAEGEGATFDVTGTQTLVGSSENTFSYTLNEGTNADNYDISTTNGTLTVNDQNVDDDLVVTKSHDEGSFGLGDTVTFNITATNIYADPQTITLEEIDGVTLAQSEFADVPAGETVETTATYTITEADIIAQTFTNTVTAKVGNVTKKAEDTVTASEIDDPQPSLSVTKETTSEAPADGYALGDTIEYKITVTNDGNLTISNIKVTDTVAGYDAEDITANLDKTTLAPGESATATFTHEVTEQDILAGSVKNDATATGDNESDDPTDPGDGDTEDPVEDPDPSLSVEKETTSTPANGDKYALGETIEYKITVTNDGNLTISDIKVTDTVAGYDAEDITANLDKTTLAPGESATATFTHEVTEQDILAGTVKNDATADGSNKSDDPTDPGDGDTEDPIEDPQPSLSVEKKTVSTPENGETYALGETIEYEITVTNDGNLTISDIQVTDTVAGYDAEDISAALDKSELAPGESAVAKFTHEVTEQDILAGTVKNDATADGSNKSDDPTDPGDGTTEDPTDDPQPKLSSEKTSTGKMTGKDENGKAAYAEGDELTYTISVTNEGNLTATDIKVVDEKLGYTEDSPYVYEGSIEPGKTVDVLVEKYTVTEEDVEAGSVLNEATVTGTTPGGDPNPAPSKDEQPVEVIFTITYDPNGGNFDGDTSDVIVHAKYDEVITIIDAPDRDGYEFTYWKGSSYQPGQSYKVTGDHTFTAQWKAESKTTPTTPTKATTPTKSLPKTGDTNNTEPLGLLALMSLLAVFVSGRKLRSLRD